MQERNKRLVTYTKASNNSKYVSSDGHSGVGAAGRSALTDNFDACRDLSGRRLRHVNAEQKLAEWAAGAKERELEKVGLKHIRAQEKAALREARAQVRGLLLEFLSQSCRRCICRCADKLLCTCLPRGTQLLPQ
jgi:hypothetical protein